MATRASPEMTPRERVNIYLMIIRVLVVLQIIGLALCVPQVTLATALQWKSSMFYRLAFSFITTAGCMALMGYFFSVTARTPNYTLTRGEVIVLPLVLGLQGLWQLVVATNLIIDLLNCITLSYCSNPPGAIHPGMWGLLIVSVLAVVAAILGALSIVDLGALVGPEGAAKPATAGKRGGGRTGRGRSAAATVGARYMPLYDYPQQDDDIVSEQDMTRVVDQLRC